MSDGYKVYASQDYVDDKTSEKNYKTINGQSILGEGDISTNEEWELINSSDDVELRSVSINNDGKYSRFIIMFGGKAKTTASTWKLVTNGHRVTYLEEKIPTHTYGGGTYFFVELPKNAPALFSCSTSTSGGLGSGVLKQSYTTYSSSDVINFGLIPNDSSLEYDSLSVKVWGVKA